MTGSHDTLPAPELPAESRQALIVATTVYTDPVLRRLRSPAQDAAGLTETLGDPTIGGFDVKSVADGTAHELRVALEDFLVDRNATDLLLVYISCHGVLDARGRLHFAASDTLTSRLAATGVGSRWLLEQMEDSRARRQVLILDCCFSGAFERGTKAGEATDLGQQLGGHSRGRVVLTASRASEYSFEGKPLGDPVAGSVFTTALLEGLRTGQADMNNDGYISVDEAYDYAFAQARAKGAPQTPQRWVYGAEGESIVLARSPAGITIGAAPLPEALRAGLENPYPEIRLGAVHVLQQWLDGPDPAKMLAARQALHRVVDSDIATVSDSARALLEGQTVPPRASGARRLRPPEPGPNQRPDPDIPLADSDSQGIDELIASMFADSDGAPLSPASPLEDRASGLVARYLFPTERFRGEWKRHPIFLAKRAALGVTAMLLFLFGTPTLLANLDSAAVDDIPTGAGYVIAGAALVWTAWGPAAWHWQRLVLTNKRIMVVRGVLIRRVAMLPLLRVTDMKYEQSPLGRVLNYGTFRLESAGRIDRMRRLPNMPNPNELYLRIVEEMYEPAAVEARIGRDDTNDGQAADETDVD